MLLEPKSGGARPKKIFPALCAGSVAPTFAPDRCPLPTFKFVPATLLMAIGLRLFWRGNLNVKYGLSEISLHSIYFDFTDAVRS